MIYGIQYSMVSEFRNMMKTDGESSDNLKAYQIFNLMVVEQYLHGY